MQAAPAGADCVLQWARAVDRADTLRGADVARAWQAVDLPAAETALGVRERVAAADRSTISAESLFVYSWVMEGSRYRLKQLGGPGPG
jgi:hypothetical protein